MAEFDPGKKLTLLSLSWMRLRISDILAVPVDLAEQRMLKDEVKTRAERESIVVF